LALVAKRELSELIMNNKKLPAETPQKKLRRTLIIAAAIAAIIAQPVSSSYAIKSGQFEIFRLSISNFNDDVPCVAGSASPGSCAALATTRQEIAATMSETDKTNLFKRVSVESSSSYEHKKAMMETIFNRTISWNMGSIQCVIAADNSDIDCAGNNGAGYWGSAWPGSLSGNIDEWERAFREVVDGSNFANFADGNVSKADAEWNKRFVNATGCALPYGESTCQPMPTGLSEVKDNIEYYVRHKSLSSQWDNIVSSCGGYNTSTNVAATNTTCSDDNSELITGSIADVARQLASFENPCYLYGGGHGDAPKAQDLQKKIDNKFQGGNKKISNGKVSSEFGVDCSGFVRAAVWKATGVDVNFVALANGSGLPLKYFDEVRPSEAQPGDVFTTVGYGHTGIILKNKGGGKFTIAHSSRSGCGANNGPHIAEQASVGRIWRFKEK
jgi:cell wall-associated NlpC family hydrolase